MNENASRVMQRVNELVGEYRTRRLWLLREDHCPQTPAAVCPVLEYIERHGDLSAFQKAATRRHSLVEASTISSGA
jgi:hypothetical protein